MHDRKPNYNISYYKICFKIMNFHACYKYVSNKEIKRSIAAWKSRLKWKR